MTALILTMTTAGLGRFTAAQTDAGVDLTITHVGLSATDFVAAPTLTALPGEFRRVTTVSGAVVDSNIVHMTVQDDAAVTYSVRGFGLFLADGTLFAAYCQPTVLVEKSVGSMLGLAIDIAFPQANIDNIRFGDTSFLNPPATTDRKGVVELATLAEAQAGDAARVTTGAVVKAMIANVIAALNSGLAAVTDAIEGLRARTIYGSGLVKGGGSLGANITLTVDAATAAQVRDGTAGHVVITPAALRQAYSTSIDGTSWHRVHPDGWIEMGGVAASRSNEGAFSLAFDPPFPNACLGVEPMTRNTNMTVDGQTTIQEVALYPSRADLFVQNHQSAANEAGGFRWRAWGY